jgi:hypothetical protein
MKPWLLTNGRLAAGLAVSAVALLYFVLHFHQGLWQPSVDLAWATAVFAWLFATWRRRVAEVAPLRHPYWFYALYALALTPFATNWRWAMAGDSSGWVSIGILMVEEGPARSLLSVQGVAQFTYTQSCLHNLFMWLIAPTLFWHRFGQILVGVGCMAAMFSVYGRLVNRWFGLAVAACTMTTSVMIVHTYCSYPLIDAIFIGHTMWAAGLWVQRQPESRTAWLAVGAATGAMFYLTANGWIMAVCVWGWLLPQVLWKRWPLTQLVVAGGTGLLIALPVLIQIMRGEAANMFSLVENPGYTAEKVRQFLYEAATFPVLSPLQSAGAFGPQLPPGFRWSFVVGVLIAPIVGGRFFPRARLVLWFLLMNVLFIAFSQGPYASVSVKRALMLIPMATYFALIPFHRVLRHWAVALLVIAIWASFGVSDLVYRMQPGRTGYTFLDGIVEAGQRFGDRRVCIYLSRDNWSEEFAKGGLFDRLYDLHPRLRQVADVHDPQCAEVLCYCPQIDGHLDLATLGYTEVQMLNTVELRCGERRTAH